MKSEKNQIWGYGVNTDEEPGGKGILRQVKSYTDEIMVVENHFQKGAVGAMHSHPHTQITYVLSGVFEFTIGDEKSIVKQGDTMLKKDGIRHGCVCLEEGSLLDIFSPMREDFI